MISMPCVLVTVLATGIKMQVISFENQDIMKNMIFPN